MKYLKFILSSLIFFAIIGCQVKIKDSFERTESDYEVINYHYQTYKDDLLHLDFKLFLGSLNITSIDSDILNYSINIGSGSNYEIVDSRVAGQRRIFYQEKPLNDVNTIDSSNKCEVNVNAKHLHKITVDLASWGNIFIDLDETTLEEMEISLSGGKLHIKLSEPLLKDLEVQINAGVSHLTIETAEEINVKARIEDSLNLITTDGFNKTGGYYYNENYQEEGPVMSINIVCGIGKIYLKQK